MTDHDDDIGAEINERELGAQGIALARRFSPPPNAEEQAALDAAAEWVCSTCGGTRTIQPDPASPPEPCPRCVNEDEEPDDQALVGALLAQAGYVVEDLCQVDKVAILCDTDRDTLAQSLHFLDRILENLITARDDVAQSLANLMEDELELIGGHTVKRTRSVKTEWDKDGAWRAARANIIDRWASLQTEKIELVDRVMTDIDVGFSMTPRVTGLKAIGVNGYEYRATTPATRWSVKVT